MPGGLLEVVAHGHAAADELVGELTMAAVERYEAMDALSPPARNIAVNQSRLERQEVLAQQASQEPGAA